MKSNYRGEDGKDPAAAISPRPPQTMGPPADDPRNRGNRKQILPASAPVSSLLPPIPAPAQAVHSQILALLNTRQPSAPFQGHQAHQGHQGHHPVMSTHATANAVALPPPPNSHLAPANIHHHCSLAQLGTTYYLWIGCLTDGYEKFITSSFSFFFCLLIESMYIQKNMSPCCIDSTRRSHRMLH